MKKLEKLTKYGMEKTQSANVLGGREISYTICHDYTHGTNCSDDNWEKSDDEGKIIDSGHSGNC